MTLLPFKMIILGHIQVLLYIHNYNCSFAQGMKHFILICVIVDEMRK